MNHDVKSLKQDLRKLILEQNKKYSEQSRASFSQSIVVNLKLFFLDLIESLLSCKLIGTENAAKLNIAIYNSLNSEPNLEKLTLDPELNQYILWVYPKMNSSESTLSFHANAIKHQKNIMGILEPEQGEEIKISELDLIVVPGLAFAKDGARLGRGKGFYDRLLAQVEVMKLGVQFNFNILDQIPAESHDIKMDYVVSDQFIYKNTKLNRKVKTSAGEFDFKAQKIAPVLFTADC